MAPQLWHVGVGAHPQRPGWTPPRRSTAPRAVLARASAFGEPMSDEDIADTIAAFGQRGGRRQGAGLRRGRDPRRARLPDRPVLLGRHQPADRRATAARPSPSARRFAAEVVKAVRAAVGPGLSDPARCRQWKQQDYAVAAAADARGDGAWLGAAGRCRGRHPALLAAPVLGARVRGLASLNFAGWAKKLTGMPTITVGSVGLSGEFIAAFRGESQPGRLRSTGLAPGARRVRPGRGRPRAAVRSAMGRRSRGPQRGAVRCVCQWHS